MEIKGTDQYFVVHPQVTINHNEATMWHPKSLIIMHIDTYQMMNNDHALKSYQNR